jgi:prevent-host-death family protein
MKNTTIVGLKELRENTEEYIGKIKKGRSFVVVRRSRPVFKIAPVDSWGDDGVWETIVDFQEIAKDGVRAKDVLKSLRKSNGSHR